MGNHCVKLKIKRKSKIKHVSDEKPILTFEQAAVIGNNWKILKLDIANIGTMTFVG